MWNWIRIRTARSAAIKHISLTTRWVPEVAAGIPKRGLRVVHGWREGARHRVFERVVRRSPERYVIVAGPEVVNTFVEMAPVRAPGLAWREDDPLVRRPERVVTEVVDAARRDELRTLLRRIDDDPRRGLEQAAESHIEWLSSSAKRALRALAGQLP